jgi:hypothetical protein
MRNAPKFTKAREQQAVRYLRRTARLRAGEKHGEVRNLVASMWAEIKELRGIHREVNRLVRRVDAAEQLTRFLTRARS